MRKYTDLDERAIRVRRLVDQWLRSRLIDPAQHRRLTDDLHVDLRRTNVFLRVILFGFSLLIIGASVGLIGELIDISGSIAGATLCLIAAGGCVALVEFLIDRFRLYRFGIEEACAVGAVVLVAVATALLAGSTSGLAFSNRETFAASIAASAAAFTVYGRYGYLYAALAAMLCAGLAPFQLHLPQMMQRLIAAAALGGCFVAARMKRRVHGDEFPGDEYGVIQAAAWLGVYAALNAHVFFAFSSGSLAPPFYWFTYAMIWTLPAAGVWLSIRDRDLPLLDASLVMALATLVTNKPYLGEVSKPWDPILLGLLLIAVAIVGRRWLAAGPGGSRNGYTAARVLRSDKDNVAAVGLASVIQSPGTRHPDPSPDSFEHGGGRSGGGGAGASF